MESAITSVATPAATPRIENKVTSRSTAGRYGERKYRRATNHSNRMDESHERKDTLRAARFGSGVLPRLCTEQRKKNDVAYRLRIGEQHRQPINADAFAGRWRHAVAKSADVVRVELLGNFFPALRDLSQEAPLLLRGI